MPFNFKESYVESTKRIKNRSFQPILFTGTDVDDVAGTDVESVKINFDTMMLNGKKHLMTCFYYQKDGKLHKVSDIKNLHDVEKYLKSGTEIEFIGCCTVYVIDGKWGIKIVAKRITIKKIVKNSNKNNIVFDDEKVESKVSIKDLLKEFDAGTYVDEESDVETDVDKSDLSE